MKKFIKSILTDRIYGRMAWQWLFRRLYKASLFGLGFGSDSLDHEIAAAFRLIEDDLHVTILDVGANVGDWSLALKDRLISADIFYAIYAFEPSPAAFRKLKENTNIDEEITPVNIGMADEVGHAVLHSNEAGSGLGSLYKRKVATSFESEENVKVGTVDTFCATSRIQRVDFLKIDTEGAELRVLQGAKSMIASGAILNIQFEFGGTQIDSRTFFRDFWELLSPRYEIYRVLKDGLWPIPHYSANDEIFGRCNYMAVLKN